MEKYIFEIERIDEDENVQFVIDAASEKIAKVFAERLNPSSKLIRIEKMDEDFATEINGIFGY